MVLTVNNGVRCKFCNAEEVSRCGKRKTRSGEKQVYRCGKCLRRFSNSNRTGKQTAPAAILRALILVCQGYPYDDIRYVLRREFNVNRTKAAISHWIAEYRPPYLALRERLQSDAGPLVAAHLFTHRGVPYKYQLHRGKLRFAKAFPGLCRYLVGLPKTLDDAIFERAEHCSGRRLCQNPGLRHRSLPPLCRGVLDAVTFAGSNRQRHQVVEEYLLNCDRDTIAVEVPVYFYDKQLGSIAGHIDVVQVKYGQVWILDYKPGAAREDPVQVVSQLTLYANALALRTRVPMSRIRCAYLDEKDWFEFQPDYLTRLVRATPAPAVAPADGRFALYRGD